ncbi:hypothetical protein PoB_006265900 [Plakobranchus ocellatus]|uniref:Uncharacterized protein n=1 Tax=Plakobranchus ocellatus TaxID=259542 RepID=A0AAV4CW68_9GAST|nr:hypothetical protein PoB_006265900 [Plakobranchus ocellatus]
MNERSSTTGPHQLKEFLPLSLEDREESCYQAPGPEGSPAAKSGGQIGVLSPTLDYCRAARTEESCAEKPSGMKGALPLKEFLLPSLKDR